MAWLNGQAVSLKELIEAYCQVNNFVSGVPERMDEDEIILLSIEWYDPLVDGNYKFTHEGYIKKKLKNSLKRKIKLGKTHGQPGFLREEILYIGLSLDRTKIIVKTPSFKLEQDPIDYNSREIQEILKYIECKSTIANKDL